MTGALWARVGELIGNSAIGTAAAAAAAAGSVGMVIARRAGEYTTGAVATADGREGIADGGDPATTGDGNEEEDDEGEKIVVIGVVVNVVVVAAVSGC